MKRLILSMVVCMICLCISAQNSVDVLTISGRYGFPQAYENNMPGKATESGGLVNLFMGFNICENIVWFNDISYIHSSIVSDVQMPQDVVDPVKLHGFILQTGLRKRINESHALMLVFTPRYMTDFHESSETSLQLGGTFLFEKEFNHNLTMRYGALFNQEFFGPMVVPLVYLNWHLSDKWNISGLLPIYSKIKYKANDNINLGIGHFGLVTSYRLGEPENAEYYMERKCIDIFFFCRYRLFGNLHAEGRAGYALSRDYAQYETNEKMDFRLSIIGFGDNRTQFNTSFNDGPIIDLRLVYNIPLPD
ncbi:MAG: hypothetical protein JSV22_08310 [Bacteroidales bacterium]|nr:MAG: hypothetical protein JSV22_08310 [Bacteroidales bacterium]